MSIFQRLGVRGSGRGGQGLWLTAMRPHRFSDGDLPGSQFYRILEIIPEELTWIPVLWLSQQFYKYLIPYIPSLSASIT